MTNVTGGAQGVRQIPFYNLFGFEINTRVRMYYFLLVGVVLFGFISWRIIHSKWGRVFFAVRDNIDAIDACGISSASVKIIAFTLAAVFGTIAGASVCALLQLHQPVHLCAEPVGVLCRHGYDRRAAER